MSAHRAAAATDRFSDRVQERRLDRESPFFGEEVDDWRTLRPVGGKPHRSSENWLVTSLSRQITVLALQDSGLLREI